MIFDSAIDCLQSLIADGEDAVAYNVALLLGENSADSGWSDACYRLDSIITTWNSSCYEPGDRWVERDVSNLQSLEEFLSSSFVIDRDVVGCVELALRIVVDVDMHTIRDHSTRSRIELKIEQRLERAATIEDGIDESFDSALLALIFFAAKFHAAVKLQCEIRVL